MFSSGGFHRQTKMLLGKEFWNFGRKEEITMFMPSMVGYRYFLESPNISFATYLV